MTNVRACSVVVLLALSPAIASAQGATFTVKQLTPETALVAAQAALKKCRWRFVRKTITIGELGRTFVERVRLFEPSELAALCTQAGFIVDAMLGDYDGTAMRPDAPRTILFARRP